VKYKQILSQVWLVEIETPEDLTEFLDSTNEAVVLGEKPDDQARDEFDDLMDMFK